MPDKPFHPVYYRPDDTVVFLAMPGTPNQAMLDVLHRNMPPREILTSGKSSDDPYLVCAAYFGEWRGQIAAPLCVTMLREPLARTLAAYTEDLKTGIFEEGVTLEAYLSETRFEDSVDNVQVRRLVGNLPLNITSEASLYLASEHLQQCAAFGLAEQIQESVLALSYCFGWAVENGSPSGLLDQAPAFQPERLSPQVHDLLIERNRLDSVLYELACRHFEQNLTHLVTTLLDSQFGAASHKADFARPTADLESHLALRTILMLREMRLRLIPPGSRLEKGFAWLVRKAVG